jgi:tetratricopeptide (TPR) repeat protein
MSKMYLKINHNTITVPQAILILIIFFFCICVVTQSLAADKSSAPVSTKAAESKPDSKKEDPKTLSKEMYSNYFLASISISRGEYKKAKPYLEKAYKNDPASLYLNKKMAVLFEKLGDFKGALKYARRCVEIDDKDLTSHMLLAELAAMSGDNDTEKKEYKAILALDPSQQRVRFLLATALMKNNQLEEAMKQLDELISENPNLPFAYYYKSRIYLEWGKYQDAENGYLKTLDLDDTFEPALLDLASLYQSQKRLDEAIKLYQKLVSLYPNNRMAQERLMGLYNALGQKENLKELIGNIQSEFKPGDPGRQTLGIYYLQNGKVADAISELALVVTAWPDDYKSRYFLALAYEEARQTDKALEHFRLIKQESEYFVNSQIHMVYILSDTGKETEGMEVLQKAIKTKKDEASFYIILASIYEEKNDYKKAVSILQDGLKYNEKDTDLYFRLGVALDKSGDKIGSIDQMKKVLEIDPNQAEALNYIGYSYAEEGIKLDEALDMIQKALRLKPDSGFIIDSLGWVYFRKGLYDDALSSLQKAFSLKSDDPTIAEHLGDVYFKKNEYQQSLEMYQKALSLKHDETDKLIDKIKEVKKFLE